MFRDGTATKLCMLKPKFRRIAGCMADKNFFAMIMPSLLQVDLRQLVTEKSDIVKRPVFCEVAEEYLKKVQKNARVICKGAWQSTNNFSAVLVFPPQVV